MNPIDRCRVTEELNEHEIKEANLPEPPTDEVIEKEAIKAVEWFRYNVEVCMELLYINAMSDGDASYTADIANRYIELIQEEDFDGAKELTNDLVNQWVYRQLREDYDTRTAVRGLLLIATT